MPTEPLIPPTVGIDDAPLHTICINAEWWSHVSGQIARLLSRDNWQGTEAEIDSAIQSIYEILDVGLPSSECVGSMTIQYPKSATFWHEQATILTGSALVVSSLASAPYNVPNSFYNIISYQGSAANGDSFEQPFLIDAGDYEFKVLGALNSSHGKLDWYLDDEVTPFVSGQDWYSGALVANTIKSGSVTITEGGLHVLKGVVNGRNGSNTLAYAIPLTKYWLREV